MNRFIAAALRIPRIGVQILTSPLPAPLRRTLFKDYLLSIELKRFGKSGTPLSLAGYSVNYLHFGGLVFQFHELFVQAHYFVSLESNHPYIIDCGSNIGLSVMFFAKLYPDAIILAFEPDPDAYACLTRNVQDNGLNNVTTECVAITDKEGEVDFYSDENRPGSALGSIIPGRVQGSRQRVPSRTLSSLINGKVDLLKIDIEGAELQVVRDLAEEGKLSFIQNCLIEFHHHIQPGENHLAELLSFLERAGFGYMISAPDYPGHRPGKYQDILIYAYKLT
ncbi:MAG: FkbM family methyltransferase [Anaerolineales bacterium]